MLERKLNGQEILDIVSNHYSETAFGYGEWDDATNLPEDFKFSDEVEKARKERDEKYAAYTSHPGYKDSKERDEEWERVREEYLNVPYESTIKAKEILNFLGLGEIVHTEQVGGEGEGDHWHQVWYFKDHDVYIKITGNYSSYHGTDFYDGYGVEVKPVAKTITVFE